MLKNPPKDLRINIENLTGFYRGVVEDNKDPLKAGRVRIRIHGLHTPKITKNDIEGIPTDELPWAEPCMPIHEGSISGFGSWAVPLQGSQVMVFFENSNPSEPRYFASLPGIPESKEQYSNNNRETNKSDGFKDPDGQYPVNGRLGEPDFHRLSRGISKETLVTTKNNERDLGVPTALGGSWSEPISPYNSQYPHNHVIATHGGITIELDSTPGSTRLHLYHPSNSFIEIDNNGNMVVKNDGEKYEIIAEGKNIHIKQQRNLTIDAGSKKRIAEDETIEINGSKEEQITNNMSQTIGGNKTEDIGGNKTEDIDGNKTEDIDGNKTEDIGGNKTEDIGGALNITVTGAANITSDGTTTVTAPTINLTGTVNLANQGSLKKIMNATAASVYNSHTHKENGDGGGTTDPPNQQMSSSELTTNTQAS